MKSRQNNLVNRWWRWRNSCEGIMLSSVCLDQKKLIELV